MADEPKAPPAAESGEDEGEGSSKPEGGEGKQQEEALYTQSKLEELLQDRLKRERKRLEAQIASDIEKRLLGDDDFRQTALKQWEITPSKKQNATALDDQKVKELHEAWEADHLAPLQTKAQELEQEVQRSREDGLESALLSAGGPRLQKAVTKRVGGEHGRTPLFQMLRSHFVFDAEDKVWRVRGKDGDYAPSPTGEKLYMSVDEFLDRWVREPDNAAFVRDTTQGGSGYEGPSSKGGKKVYTRQEYNRLVNDEQYYAKHRDELLAAANEGRVR